MKKHLLLFVLLITTTLLFSNCSPIGEIEDQNNANPSFAYYIKYLNKIIDSADKLKVSDEAKESGVVEVYFYEASPKVPSMLKSELIKMQETEYNLGITNVLLMYNESEIYEDSEGEYSYIMLALAGASTSYQPSEIMGASLVDGIIKIDMGINVPECANAEVLDAMMLIKVDSSFVGKDADGIEFNFINVR